MNAPIDYQIIEQGGKPAFAVLPYNEFMSLISNRAAVVEDGLIPHDIVERNVLNGVPLVKCWREHLGLTQTELAEKAGMPQSSVARIEADASIKVRKSTLEALAGAMDLNVDQLEE